MTQDDLGNNPDGGAQPDLTDDTNPDGGPVEPNRCHGDGCIGGPCTGAAQCTEGVMAKAKVCWKNLLGNSAFVPTPDGYCTQECDTSADCGTGYCYQPPVGTKKYCMALCRTANTCRHPGYACVFESGAGMDGICYPSQNIAPPPEGFGCKPTLGNCDPVIDANGTIGKKGGCIRAAFEDMGICHVACKVGTKTCPNDYRFGSMNAAAQHCVFIDTTTDAVGRPSPTGDKWKGGACLPYAPTQVQPGTRCSFWDECTDGYQCDRYAPKMTDQVCRRLCAQGTGVQADDLYPDATQATMMGSMVFNNMCPNASDGCANSLQSGVANGQPGLCAPK